MNTHDISYDGDQIEVVTRPVADSKVRMYKYVFDFNEDERRALLVTKVIRYERGDSYQVDREVTGTVRKIVKREFGDSVTVAEPDVKDPMEA